MGNVVLMDWWYVPPCTAAITPRDADAAGSTSAPGTDARCSDAHESCSAQTHTETAQSWCFNIVLNIEIYQTCYINENGYFA